MCKKVIVIGGGGHAKVVIDCIQCAGDTVVGILDDGMEVGSTILGIPVLGKISDHARYPDCSFIIAIGGNEVRKAIADKFNFTSLEFQTLEGTIKAIGLDPCKLCTYCWNGQG